MKRIFLLIAIFLLSSTVLAQERFVRVPAPVDFRPFIQGVKIWQLPAQTALTDDDIFLVVDSPGSSPIGKKITVGNVKLSFFSAPAIVSFANAVHTHANGAGGGQLGLSAFPSSVLQGNGSKFLLFGGGSIATNDCAKFDANGNVVSAGAACGAGGGTVTSLSVTTANGISGSVANATTTPAITLNIAALDASKIGGGGVSTAEFNFLGTVTSNVQDQIDGKQGLDADLVAIAGLSPSNDDFMQRKAGAWTNRTIAQVKTDLGLSGTNSGDQVISDATITTTDVTTNNATTSKHGFLKKLSNVATEYLDGTGNWSVPAGGGTVTPTSTDTLTNKTMDVEATGNLLTLPFKFYFPAAFCSNATAAAGFNLETSNIPTPACVTGTNTQKGVLEFPDSDGDYAAQVETLLPADFSGAIDARFRWFSSTATSGNVVLQIQTACAADAETDDPSWNTASTVTDAAKGTVNQMNDASITGITITGCAAGEMLHVRILRNRTHASDSINGIVKLVGLELTLRRGL